MRRPCIFVARNSNSVYIQTYETCPAVGARGEVVYTALTQVEVDKLMLSADLFSFDPDLFSKFVLYFILLFLSGYFGGLMARKLGR
ncbi:hypothetical protein [Aeromonas dhakensis]|uniref:hypothetical protein n=1 Tax=Aeromonas dhakensis TaxID=196024 RepID=UPI00244A4274|nr:hypothetical protein [Aeromonas dhakensis]MDH0349093.1 hypothetical protein [Aeromonas dhakensis]